MPKQKDQPTRNRGLMLRSSVWDMKQLVGSRPYECGVFTQPTTKGIMEWDIKEVNTGLAELLEKYQETSAAHRFAWNLLNIRKRQLLTGDERVKETGNVVGMRFGFGLV